MVFILLVIVESYFFYKQVHTLRCNILIWFAGTLERKVIIFKETHAALIVYVIFF